MDFILTIKYLINLFLCLTLRCFYPEGRVVPPRRRRQQQLVFFLFLWRALAKMEGPFFNHQRLVIRGRG